MAAVWEDERERRRSGEGIGLVLGRGAAAGPWPNWSGWLQVAAGLRMGLDGLLGRTLSFLLFSLAENY